MRSMKLSFVVVALLALGACGTKRNPDTCCVSEADCAANGISEITPCESGLLCRGNRCVEAECDSSARCDPSAPYCVAAPEGTCQEMCTMDTECPGFGQSSERAYCDGAACVECRAGMADCNGEKPVCDEGSCRRCQAHSECASGVCEVDGSCADESSIAYVETTGSPSSSCARAAPCTLTRALQVMPALPYVLLGSGSYQLPSTLTIDGRRSVIGAGAVRPIITNNNTGPIIKLGFGANVTIENVELTGAKNGMTPPSTNAYGIECPSNQSSALTVISAIFSRNPGAGIKSGSCTVMVSESRFLENGFGVTTIDASASFDRCAFTSNTTALYLDAGLYSITNSFIVRNGTGIELFANAGSKVEFNTIVDNTNVGFVCQSFAGAIAFPNNVIARNGMNTMDFGDCTYPSSIIAGSDISPLRFKSPDTAPFDYHVQTGSAAVDAASSSTLATDFDGEARPAGAARDVGADELH